MLTRFFGYVAAFALIVILLTGPASLPLRAQGTNGTISGTVTDPSGAVVSGAKVDVKNVRTGVTRSATTNEQGRYRVPDLIVGEYYT